MLDFKQFPFSVESVGQALEDHCEPHLQSSMQS